MPVLEPPFVGFLVGSYGENVVAFDGHEVADAGVVDEAGVVGAGDAGVG